jgi:hypothetical protein
MPVTTQVGRAHRHDDDVTDSPGDLLLAPRAHVRLASLEGMDAADLHRVVGIRAATVPRHE